MSSSTRRASEPNSGFARLVSAGLLVLAAALVAPYLGSLLSSPQQRIESPLPSTSQSKQVVEVLADPSGHTLAPHSQQQRPTGEDVFRFGHQDALVRDAAQKAARSRARESRRPSAEAQPSIEDEGEDADDDEQQQRQPVFKRGEKPKATRRSANGRTSANGKRSANGVQRAAATADSGDNDEEAAPLLPLDWLVALLRLGLRILYYLSLPLVYLVRVVGALTVALYRGFRLALSHALRPVAVAFAPLGYLVAGLVYLLYTAPMRVVSAVGREVYPIYIFLGVASTVGLSMGAAAAAVLYVTAFLFHDHTREARGAAAVLRSQEQRSERGAKEAGSASTGKGKGRAKVKVKVEASGAEREARAYADDGDEWRREVRAGPLSASYDGSGGARRMSEEWEDEEDEWPGEGQEEGREGGGGGGGVAGGERYGFGGAGARPGERRNFPVGATARTAWGHRTTRTGGGVGSGGGPLSPQQSFYGSYAAWTPPTSAGLASRG
ncbi:hypothetical protein ACQY0O_008192 [Thecaphora frezii]